MIRMNLYWKYSRTQKATGYIAWTKEWKINDIGAVVIAASSNVNHYSVEEVTQFQIEAVEFFKTQFDLLSYEGFERAKQAYVRFLKRIFLTSNWHTQKQ